MPGRTWSLLGAIALVACDSPPPQPSADAGAAGASAAAPSLPPRDPHAELPEPERAPAPALASADLAGHTRSAERVRVWQQQSGADAGPRIAAFLVTDPKLVARLRAAVGFEQRPVPAEACERCPASVRLVFETALGLEVGSIDLGCPGAARGQGRFWQPASRRCGTIAIRDPDGFDSALAEARRHPAKEPQLGLP
jgi:hypothetical protein